LRCGCWRSAVNAGIPPSIEPGAGERRRSILVDFGKTKLRLQGCVRPGKQEKDQSGCWFKVANITEISGNAVSFALV